MPQVRLSHRRIQKIAEVVAGLDAGKPLNFYSYPDKEGKEVPAKDMYPGLDVPEEHVINFFVFVGWNEYGFWLRDKKGYVSPLYGTLKGKSNIKGSDLLWRLAKLAFDRDPDIFTPEQLFSMQRSEWTEIMSDDNGPAPLLSSEERFERSRRYAAYFLSEEYTPAALVRAAQASKNQVKTFLSYLLRVPGYKEDPLQKKAILLAMALANRPEKFLTAPASWKWPPIIDTHLQRVALRQGLITLPREWERKNIARQHTTIDREKDIRDASRNAVNEVIRLSGRSMSEVDVIFWMARKYCPEMSTPDCASCKFNVACAKRTELFQPILETSAY